MILYCIVLDYLMINYSIFEYASHKRGACLTNWRFNREKKELDPDYGVYRSKCKNSI